MKHRDLYEVKAYSPLFVLNKVKEEKIDIYDFKKIDDITYTFYAEGKDEKRIKKIFRDVKIIHRSILKEILHSFIKKKTTLIALIFALSSFIFASTRVFSLKISGGSDNIDEVIITKLREEKIYRFSALPSVSKLKSIEDELYESLIDKIERIEIVKTGLSIDIKYEKRRSPIILPSLNHDLIAKRDGVIAQVNIEYGQCLVSVGEKVTEGQVLVSEDIPINDKETFKTFTLGKIMAYTWYDIDVSVKNTQDEAENMLNLIQLGDSIVLTKDKTLEDRKMLSYKKNGSNIEAKFHYTVLENIAICS